MDTISEKRVRYIRMLTRLHAINEELAHQIRVAAPLMTNKEADVVVAKLRQVPGRKQEVMA